MTKAIEPTRREKTLHQAQHELAMSVEQLNYALRCNQAEKETHIFHALRRLAWLTDALQELEIGHRTPPPR